MSALHEVNDLAMAAGVPLMTYVIKRMLALKEESLDLILWGEENGIPTEEEIGEMNVFEKFKTVGVMDRVKKCVEEQNLLDRFMVEYNHLESIGLTTMSEGAL